MFKECFPCPRIYRYHQRRQRHRPFQLRQFQQNDRDFWSDAYGIRGPARQNPPRARCRGLDPETVEIVRETGGGPDLAIVKAQAAKETPPGGAILFRLKGAAETIKSVATIAGAGVTVLPMFHEAIAMAEKLFH